MPVHVTQGLAFGQSGLKPNPCHSHSISMVHNPIFSNGSSIQPACSIIDQEKKKNPHGLPQQTLREGNNSANFLANMGLVWLPVSLIVYPGDGVCMLSANLQERMKRRLEIDRIKVGLLMF